METSHETLQDAPSPCRSCPSLSRVLREGCGAGIKSYWDLRLVFPPLPAGKGTQLAGGYHWTSCFRASAGTLLTGPCPRGSEAAEPFTAGKELLVGEELTELENAVTMA